MIIYKYPLKSSRISRDRQPTRCGALSRLSLGHILGLEIEKDNCIIILCNFFAVSLIYFVVLFLFSLIESLLMRYHLIS